MIKNIIIGLFAGVVSGLFASGGGMIVVPAFINILKMDEPRSESYFCFFNIANGNSKRLFLFQE